MSQYIHFFIRDSDNFIPIGTYSRSHEIYQTFYSLAPYERIGCLTKENIYEKINVIKESIHYKKEDISQCSRMIKDIPAFSNPLDEKLGAIESLKEELEGHREALRDFYIAYDFCSFLMNIIREAEDLEKDPTQCLYLGIECGSKVTSEMIQEQKIETF